MPRRPDLLGGMARALGFRRRPDRLFSYFQNEYEDSIERMFASVSDLYARYWGECFHFALFNGDGESREEALENTHRKYLDALRVDEARDVLDLACGRGGFTRALAANTGGRVLGVDLSRAQIARCRGFAGGNLRFERRDIMKIDELDEQFDAVALLDADCYLPDKALAIRKIATVMRPGARLLILSWCKKDRLSDVQEELVLHPFMAAWGVPGLETPASYARHFQESGLRLLEASDLNEQVAPNWELGYRQALKGVEELSKDHLPQLLWDGLKLGPDGVHLIKQQFHAAVYIKVGFDTGFLRYMFLLVEKA